jgi:hypothetical protein
MVAGAPTETMTDLRQFCSRHAARFWLAQAAADADLKTVQLIGLEIPPNVSAFATGIVE